MSGEGAGRGGVCFDGPVRTCVGCRGRSGKGQLFRLVAMDRVLVVDKDHVLAGRGAYLHRDARCVEIAVRRGLVPRALRTEGPLDISALQDLQ